MPAELFSPSVWQRIKTAFDEAAGLPPAERHTVVETLEPKPGIAPSPAHLARVIEAMKSAPARVIVVQPYQNRKTAETVARQTGATVVDISQQPGARKDTPGYFEMMDYMVRTLAGAFGAR